MAIRSASLEAPARRKGRSLLARIWESRALYLLLLPTVIGMFLFQYYPAATAFWGSFQSWDGRRSHYIGLYNYEHFFDDPRLLQSFGNVALFLIFNVISLAMPLLVAYLIYRIPNNFQRYMYRVLVVIPVVVPGFVFIVLWRWLFSLDGGINVLLRAFGINSRVIWLGNTDTALGSLMFMGFPWIDAFTVLIFLAGFLTIPHEILDAAAVDGANGFRRFFNIELPQVSGQIKVMIILTFIGTIQDFGRPLFMTKGGPGWTTMVPGLRMYDAFTSDAAYGYASAIGVILFIIIFVLTLVNQRLIRSSEEA